MAVASLTDLIVPKVFADYVNQKTEEKSALRQAGIISTDPLIQSLANGGGTHIELPYFNDLTGSDEVLPSDGTTALSVNKITTAQDRAVKILRGKAWGANEIAGLLAGADPMGAIADRVADFWVRMEQAALINSLTGVFATTLAATHVKDVTGASTALSADVILDGKQLLGDSADGLVAIAMHSAKYTALQKANLIVYQQASDATIKFPTYLGYRVIVDDACPVSGGNYTSYLFGAGAVAGANVTVPNPVETDRDSLAGNDILISRRGWIMHPRGVAFSSADSNPTNAVLATGSKWTKVYEDKAIRVVKLVTK